MAILNQILRRISNLQFRFTKQMERTYYNATI